MAFTWAQDLTGAKPIKKYFPIGATVYQGQLLSYDTAGATNGGYVIPVTAAAAGPDTTNFIVGICSAIVQSAKTYNSTYKGDTLAYSTTQATLAGYDPADAVMAEVILVTPTTLIKGPVVKDTVGTAPVVVTNSSASSGGTTVTFGQTLDTTVDGYSTMYCRTGANRGLSRKVTTVGTTSSVAVIPFPYGIAVGDTFVIANVVEGAAHIDFDTQFQGIDSTPALSNYYKAYVHTLNLETAGQEQALFTLSSSHLVIGTGV